MRQTSISEFISRECANMIAGGICLGVQFTIPPEGEIIQTLNKELTGKVCILPTERCGYFEQCLIPLVPNHPQYTEAVREYYLTTDGTNKGPELRKCSCGNPLARRKRYCEKCNRERRLQTYRRKNAKRP